MEGEGRKVGGEEGGAEKRSGEGSVSQGGAQFGVVIGRISDNIE